MTKAANLSSEEGVLLVLGLPLLVVITSVAFLQPGLSALLDKVLALYSINLRTPTSFKAARSIFALFRPGTFKALKTVYSPDIIVKDTIKPFPALQAMFETDTEAGTPGFDGLKLALEKLFSKIPLSESASPEKSTSVRDALCKQAIAILDQKGLSQEAAEYRHWLLQIARETLRKAQFKGFWRSGQKLQATRMTQFLQDFAQVLQIPESAELSAFGQGDH